MHWEARRRQSLLDRRTARDNQQVGPAPHPGRCQHLSSLKRYNGAGPPALWQRAAALLYYWREQRDLETEQRHGHLGGGQSCFLWAAHSLYPVADSRFVQHNRWFWLDLLWMIVLFSSLNLNCQRYIWKKAFSSLIVPLNQCGRQCWPVSVTGPQRGSLGAQAGVFRHEPTQDDTRHTHPG